MDCPLHMFFGSGLGETEVRAMGFSMRNGVYENHFPMPFWTGARIEVSGIAGRLAVRVAPQRYRPGEAGTFHARYVREFPTTRGRDFVWLDAAGAGKVVGTILTVEPRQPTDRQWWEGDMRTSADGARTPILNGTGHEDDHLGGWSNEFLGTPFTLPMQGCPRVEMQLHTEQYNGNATMYRLWPGITYLSGVRHSVEHGFENGSNFNYHGTVMYYALPGERLVRTDTLVAGDEASARAHELRSLEPLTPEPLTSRFEGDPAAREVTLNHTSHYGPIVFRAQIAAANRGAVLRRVYDQAVGRQMAEVLVDGERVGTWYSPDSVTVRRWVEQDFFIPARCTAGRSEIRVAIVPVVPVPFDWSEYSVFTVLP